MHIDSYIDHVLTRDEIEVYFRNCTKEMYRRKKCMKLNHRLLLNFGKEVFVKRITYYQHFYEDS